MALSERQKEVQRNFYYRHRERRLEARKTLYEKDKATKPNYMKDKARRQKHSRLKSKYGLTSEQWWDMFEEQGSVCKICKSDTTAGHNWHTDHCHETNKVRGILCYHCNLLLGMAKDSVETLQKAILYLREHNGQ